MNITILNGNPGKKSKSFAAYLAKYAKAAKAKGHAVTLFDIADMKISPCIGCFDCWLKTPGRCVHNDDAESVYRSIIKADLLIFASPVSMGFVSAMLRKINERLIPLLIPYVTLYKDECHHYLRYDSPPLLGLVLEPDKKTDDEDIQIITDCYRRTALNFKSTLQFVTLTTQPITEALNEFGHI